MGTTILSIKTSRLLRGAARFALSLALAVAVVQRAAEADPVDVAIRESEQGTYVVEGGFTVDAARPVVWAVLTDYEGIHDFVSSIRRSVVTERHPDHLLLLQEGVGRIFVFSKSIHVLLEVREDPERTIAFRDVCGKSFESYAGKWRIEDGDQGLRVSYTLRAKPAFRQPGFVTRKSMRDNVRRLLEEVRLEIESRRSS
jgi:hypothetical protein